MKKMFKKGFENTKEFVRENRKDILQIAVMAAVIVVPNLIDMNICGATILDKSGSAGTSMPWSTGLNNLQAEISGPIPKVAGVLAVAATGMMMAFGEMQGMAKKGCQIVFGLGIAISAASLVSIVSNSGTVSGLLF